MLAFLDPIREITPLSVVIRMLLAVLIGAVIGLERSAKNRPAGFRTHILVCLGAAVAAMTGLYIGLRLELTSDISRLSAQVISGLGFIVAGTIVVTKKMSIKGLTTAAGLWTTGIIGLAVGSGYYELGIVAAAAVLLAETVFNKLGKKIRQTPEYTLEVFYDEKNSLDDVLRYCKNNTMTIVRLKIHTLEDGDQAQYAAEVQLRGGVNSGDMTERVERMPGIVSVVTL